MIIVIKPGTRKKTVCNDCGCVFSYEKEDIKEKQVKKCFDGGYIPNIKYIECPQCHFQITLEAVR